ncbi:MAG: C-GCAxxG-C-C family protein [Candidatus Brocadiia bacterium]
MSINFPEKAKELYLGGYACSEAVMHAARDVGLVEIPEELLKVSTGFLAGIGHNRCLCGALAAGVMIISLEYGRADKNQSKDSADKKCSVAYKKFTDKFGSSCCKEIASFPRCSAEFLDPKRRLYCADVVKSAAEIIEEVIERK